MARSGSTTIERSCEAALAVLCAATLLGCGGDEPAGPGPSDGPPEVGFTADAQSGGPRVWIDARLEGHADALVEVWGADLGPVLGYSVHVAHDADHLTVNGSQPPSAAPALGADPGEAVYVAMATAGDVALGGVRRSPALGEVDLTTAALLGAARLHASGATTSKLALDRVVVRRADGGYVALQAFGGALTTAGAP